jgi:hypothetical protein
MIMFVAAAMLAQAPTAPASVQAVAKKKPAQVCETVEVTGSRRTLRVCHDKDAPQQIDPAVADAMPNPGMFHQVPATSNQPSVGRPH